MRSVALMAALVTSLALGNCGGNEEGALVIPDRVSNEQAHRLIRSCDVTRLLVAHSGDVCLTLEDGRTISVERPDRAALSRAAVEAQLELGCTIAVGME
jgi:ribosomal protein S4E